MSANRKIFRCIAIGILLICTAYLMFNIISDPLGEGDIMLALAVTAGFIALDSHKKQG